MNSLLESLILLIVGLVAGSINTVAGGGSAISLPLLIFLGLPPHIANGTNRIAILFQNIFAVRGFKSKGINTFPFSIYLSISALFGAVLGAQLAVDIKGDTFNKILSILMVFMVIYMLVPKNKKTEYLSPKTTGKQLWISVFLFFFVGIYGGFIQAGVGFLIIFVLSFFNGLSLTKSNAVKVFVALIYTFAAVLVFAYNDSIDWKTGLILAVGNSLGAWFTSRWSVKKGDKTIKKILIVIILILAVKLWFFD